MVRAAGGGIAKQVIGGWNVSGIQRYSSGRPLSMSMNNLYSGVLFNTALRPDRVAGVAGYANNGSKFDIINDRYLTLAGWKAPPDGRLGNATRTDPLIRGWANYNEDISLFKNFQIKERATARLGANFANIFNRHQWCDPNTNFSDAANFGLVTGQCDVPRRVEAYLRFTF